MEERLALSGQPLPDFVVDYVDAAADGGLQTDLHHLTWLARSIADGIAAGAEQVRAEFGFTGARQTVAIIDSGIAWDHVALGAGFGPGYRVVGGWDFTGEDDADPYDDGPLGSHGTHVAGIIGADDGSHLGLAPGVDLVALRVFDDRGAGYFNWVETALEWVHDHRFDFENPITTVNLSLGTSDNSDQEPAWAMLEDELAQLNADGMFIAVAAGNSFGHFGQTGLSYPASSSHVVPVMSADADGALSAFTQRHSRAIAAPGRGITSTVPDYVGNQNGRQDDFASYSGTSIASPYVAGASVLIREALAFAGGTDVTQATIYQIMRDTADTIYDTATRQTYDRLNIEAAINSVMPADDFGSTAGDAHPLCTLVDTVSVSGLIGTRTDTDFFCFTVAQAGTVTLAVDTTHDFAAQWQVIGNDVHILGDHAECLTLSVAAGATVHVGLSSAAGIGHYSVKFTFEPTWTYTELGAIACTRIEGLAPAGGDTWYRIAATRDGLLTVETLAAASGGNVDLEIYSADLERVAASRGPTDDERVDVVAAAGEVFFIRMTGASTDVDLRLTNLVKQTGQSVDVVGTAGNDVFRFVPGTTHVLFVNNVRYAFDASRATVVTFAGGAGTDFAPLAGSTGNDVAVLRPGAVDLSGPGYTVCVTDVESVLVNGRSGLDTACFHDSTGDDVFIGTPTLAKLYGAGFHNYVTHFDRVDVHASNGRDTARLYDSAGDDTFHSEPAFSTFSGPGFCHFVGNFDRVHALAGGGKDQAEFHGLGLGDTFYGRADLAQASTARSQGTASGFCRVTAVTRGGETTGVDVKSVDYVFSQIGSLV